LAAVALPQYQKAVWKSRNSELKQLVKTVTQAEQVYFMANGRYAQNFDELDIDLPLTPAHTTVGGDVGACNTTTQGTDSARLGKNYYITLNSVNTESDMEVTAYWSSGPYKCAGFAITLIGNENAKLLHCREMKSSLYTAGTNNFCVKLENGQRLEEATTTWRRYLLP
ncbi:MAG: hypothetical protein MJ053_05025, partial [Elusimicrobiaceae bacterium]|nr:hypothetical protein [Elusimicrobiaceae bacterium]